MKSKAFYIGSIAALSMSVTACAALFPGMDNDKVNAEAERKREADSQKVHEATQPDEAGMPEAKALLVELAPKWAKGEVKAGVQPPTVLAAYSVSPDWSMKRDRNSVIVGRVSKALYFYKGGESGNCYKRNCNLFQEEQGGEWGNTRIDCLISKWDVVRVTCESIDALEDKGFE